MLEKKKIWVLLYIGNAAVMHKKSYCTRKELRYSVNASFKQACVVVTAVGSLKYKHTVGTSELCFSNL